MNHRKIKLPRGTLVLVQDFTQAIAEAFFPTKNLKGIECITGLKIFTLKNTDPHGCTLEVPYSTPISENKRVSLEKLLHELPPLEYPIGELVKEKFLEAYRNHPKRLEKEPTFITQAGMDDQKTNQNRIKNEHAANIREMKKQREIELLNADLLPVKEVSFDTYISRAAALDYLKKLGIDVEENDIYSTGERSQNNDTDPAHSDHVPEAKATKPEKELGSIEQEKKLGTTERNSLLIIIMALCKEAKIDLDQPAVPKRISLAANDINLEISEETVRRHLNTAKNLQRSGAK
jgi:hypothetical protein